MNWGYSGMDAPVGSSPAGVGGQGYAMFTDPE